MRIRSAARSVSAAALVLLVALGGAACGGKDDNANNTNATRNANANTNTATTTATATATPSPAAASGDTAIKNKTEAALTKAGVSGVTVEVREGVVTLKGTLPKAKWQDAVKAAHESGAKRVMNQLSEK